MIRKPEILYEDNHLLAVFKPAGMLSQGDLSGDLDLLSLCKETLKRRDRKPGNVYLGLVHRLDRPVAGAMILAKTSKAAGRLSKQFRERATKKTYRAVVEGCPDPGAGELVHRLQKDRSTNVTRVVGAREPGKAARLGYEVLERKKQTSLVEIDLLTGLPHQIRVQLSTIGHPIVGDRKYGSRVAYQPGRIALYACSLSFRHPVRAETVTVTANPPAEWPWG